MLLMTPLTLITLLIPSLMAMLLMITSMKSNKDREKLTPFECGFDPIKKARAPFSLRFFLIALVFLIFDVEIALLLPLGLLSSVSDLPSVSTVALTLIMVLLLGLLHEWNQGALAWAN